LTELVITQQDSLLAIICRFLSAHGIESFVVGGAVRDLLMRRETSDIDIAIKGDALEIASRVADETGGTFIPLDEINRVGRVAASINGKYWYFDFSALKGDCIDDDLALRDFTVNALAVALNESTAGAFSFGGRPAVRGLEPPEVIDPFSARQDIADRLVRMVSPRAFISDPLRMLRALRFAAELGFRIQPETEEQIKKNAALASMPAGERTREELLKILALPRSARFLGYADKLGLLTVIIPELEPARETTQPVEHTWKVLEHSLHTTETIEYLLREGEWLCKEDWILAPVPWDEELHAHFNAAVGAGSAGCSLLKLAGLLHDIAKPQTKAPAENGRVRFLGHDKIGADIAAAVLERLRFSSKEIGYVRTCVKYHMRPTQLTQEEVPTKRALYRYFRDTGALAPDIMFLSLADHLAARGPMLDQELWTGHVKLVQFVLNQYYKTEEIVRPPKLVDGNELMAVFGLKPGPLVGELLETVRESRAAGEITTREDALRFLKELLQTRK
jgi:poly(A) polymerase